MVSYEIVLDSCYLFSARVMIMASECVMYSHAAMYWRWISPILSWSQEHRSERWGSVTTWYRRCHQQTTVFRNNARYSMLVFTDEFQMEVTSDAGTVWVLEWKWTRGQVGRTSCCSRFRPGLVWTSASCNCLIRGYRYAFDKLLDIQCLYDWTRKRKFKQLSCSGLCRSAAQCSSSPNCPNRASTTQ